MGRFFGGDRFPPVNPFPGAAPATVGDAPITGRRIPLSTIPGAGGFIAQATQLISARVNTPRQWVVTLAQVVPTTPAISPWPAPADGTNVTTGFQGPGGIAGLLRCALRWGAGGAAFQTEFDYPLQGVSFGIVADTLDLNVAMGVDPTLYPFATVDAIPIVGGFMVPGHSPDPAPLRWCEPSNAAPGAGASVFWSVKPYARRVRVNVYNAGANSYTIQMSGYNRLITGDSDNVYDIPAGTRFLRFINGAGGPTVSAPEWHIGLT